MVVMQGQAQRVESYVGRLDVYLSSISQGLNVFEISEQSELCIHGVGSGGVAGVACGYFG